jgi:hypothetical protein
MQPEPAPEWPRPPRPQPSRFLTQLVAALVLFSLIRVGLSRLPHPYRVLLGHTVQRWLTASTPLPPQWSQVVAQGFPSSSSPSPAGWPPPVESATRLVEGYGWHHPGPEAQFSPGLRLQSAPGTAIYGVPGGTVTAVQSQGDGVEVEEAVTADTAVVFKGLAASKVSAGQAVGTEEAVGVSGSGPWTLEVLVHGYPVDPLRSQFYGQRFHPTPGA